MGAEWRSAPLGEFASFINRGGAPAYVETGGILVLNQKCVRVDGVHLERARRTDPSIRPVQESRLLRPMDVLVNSTGVGTLGRVAQVLRLTEPTTVDSHITIVRPGDGVDGRFLGFALRCRQSEIEAMAEGSTGQTELSRARLASLTLHVPPLRLQSAIGRILGALDDKIELNRQMNRTLEEMAQALFKSWFIDFDGHDALMESELGPIPRGWRVAPLVEQTEYLRRGISPAYVEDGGVRVLNQKCIRDGRVTLDDARRHDTVRKSITGRELRPLDILVNSTGTGTLGRVAQLPNFGEPLICDSHVTVVRPAPHVRPRFFGQQLLSRQAEIESLAQGSTGQTELNRDALGGVLLVVPPAPDQARFDEAVGPLKERVFLNERQNGTLAELRDALLPKLISGEIRVPEAEKAVEATP